MTVQSLDHVNIRTDDVPAVVAFFDDVLALKPTIAPGASSMAQGTWLRDADDRPVVHVGTAQAAYPSDAIFPGSVPSQTGAIHHVAFNCTDYAGMRARIEALGHDVAANEMDAFGLRQLFVMAPGKVMLELNFWAQASE